MIISAVLGATELPLAADQQLPSLSWRGEYRAGGRADMPRFSRQLPPDNRILPLELVKEAADGEDTRDLDLWIEQVNGELAVQNTLVIESDDGSVASFNTQPSDPLPPAAGPLFRFGLTYRGTAQIEVEPFALGATATISSPDLESPGSVSLATLETVYPTPLTVTVAPTAGQPDFHALYLALAQEAFPWVVEATDVSGWDDEVADATLGVNVVRFAAGGSYDLGYVDTAGFPASAYLVLARVKADGGGTIYLDSTYKSDPEVTDDASSWHWLPMGEVALPTRRVRGAAQALLDVQGRAVTGACYVQRLAFLPLRWGFLSFHPEVGGVTAASLRAEWEDVYVDDVVDFESIMGGGLRATGGYLLVLAEEAAGDLAYYHADVTVQYRPRRNWMA